MSTETINLTLAEIGDDTQFDELFNDWQVKTIIAQHTITEASLRTICKVWFQRGIERGTDWADVEITRQLKAEIERLRQHVRDLDSDLNTACQSEPDDLSERESLGER